MSLHPNAPRPASEFKTTLASAQRGCMESLGNLLEPCRQYLLLIANQDLCHALTAKVARRTLCKKPS